MKANELRIGNWVEWVYPNRAPKLSRKEWITDREVLQVQALGRRLVGVRDSSYQYDQIEPIPLTEEWLLKSFGFSYAADPKTMYYSKVFDEVALYEFIIKRKFGRSFFYFDTKNFVTQIKHVHQLQNLYFALTGEELIIKKTA